MAGILDPKTRILDFQVTKAGRKNLADAGDLGIKFISFSDKGASYEKVPTPTNISFIAPESAKKIAIENDQLSFESYTTTQDYVAYVSGSSFGLTAKERSNKFIQNLLNLSLVQSLPPKEERDGFEYFDISSGEIEFVAEQKDPEVLTADIDGLKNVYQDRHFQHLQNYRFLPPVNSVTQNALGTFTRLNEQEILTIQQLESILQKKKSSKVDISGELSVKNLIVRLIEDTGTGAAATSAPLELIDYGVYRDGSATKRVLFAGKYEENSDGTLTFINLFTLVFDV